MGFYSCSSFREIPCHSVANASVASVFFRVSVSAFSVKFRVLPWQMLHLILALFPSVAKPSHCAE
jgi:hypothetical protein